MIGATVTSRLSSADTLLVPDAVSAPQCPRFGPHLQKRCALLNLQDIRGSLLLFPADLPGLALPPCHRSHLINTEERSGRA